MIAFAGGLRVLGLFHLSSPDERKTRARAPIPGADASSDVSATQGVSTFW
jgi:hypothetical protein